MKGKLTYERLIEVLDYDPATGVFTWKLRCVNSNPRILKGWNKRCAGKRAGCRKGHGWSTAIDGRWYRLGRLAFLIMTGKWPIYEADHKNCDPDDDRWSNLRDATPSQNSRNKRAHRDQTMPKGVSRRGDKFFGSIYLPGPKRIHLGTFRNIEEAHQAYRQAAVKYFGEFARFE